LGTHPDGTASVAGLSGAPDTPLSDVATLPFILKTLSCSKALSVQVHPSFAQAAELSSSGRDVTAAAKPELVVATSPFTLLAGARPWQDLHILLAQKQLPFVSALWRVVGDELMEDLTEWLCYVAEAGAHCDVPESLLKSTGESFRKVYAALLRAHPMTAKYEARSAAAMFRMSKGPQKTYSELERLFMQLCDDHPNEGSGFHCLLLQSHTLQPGEAMAIPAGVPHCYVRGDAVEISACSNTVVRAALTSKPVDVDLFCELMNPAAADRVIPGALDDVTLPNDPSGPGLRMLRPTAMPFVLAIARPVPSLESSRQSSPLAALLTPDATADATDAAGIDISAPPQSVGAFIWAIAAPAVLVLGGSRTLLATGDAVFLTPAEFGEARVAADVANSLFVATARVE
jgi:mannose-6-phosphate isomerase class I